MALISKEELKKALEALENRIAAFEKEYVEFRNVTRTITNSSTEVLGAVISLVGDKEVADEMTRLRAQRQKEWAERETANVAKLVEEKVLVPAEVSTKNSFVVGMDGPDGGEAVRRQFEVSQIVAEHADRYIGLKVGSEIKENGATFTVTEIYEIDQVKVAEQVQKAAAEAQAAAEAPAEAAPAVEPQVP